MAKEHIIFISSVWEWGPGDGSIIQGLYNVLPELTKYDIHFSSYYLRNYDKSKIDPLKYEELLKTAKYIIAPGSPSWMTMVHRRTWELCRKHKKHLSFLGIGMATPYDSDFWYGREEFMALKDSGLIDFIVCRDRYCYYWLQQRCGVDKAKIMTLPCPAFYTFPVGQPITERKNVVFSIADIEHTAHSTETTFRDYYRRSIEIVNRLKESKVNVSISLNEMIDENHPFYALFANMFPKEHLYRFKNPQDYIDFHKDKHLYIGVRNHGALPCAGQGIPGLLLGTDDRQLLAAEIPFLSRMDISRADWTTDFVLDWYHAVIPEDISKSLLKWRKLTFDRWRYFLAPLIKELQLTSTETLPG